MTPSLDRTGRILVLEDDHALRRMVLEFLRSQGHEVEGVADLDRARALLRARRFDLVLSDLVLGHGSGLDLLREVRAAGLPCEVIIMTGQGGVDAAVAAIRDGAYDFITKPLDLTRLAIDVARALEKKFLEDDVRRLREGAPRGFGELVGTSPAMRGVFALLDRAAATDCNVLLLGESGTGKDVAARAIHERSPRRDGPFVPVHCGAIPGDLLASELFGHVRGAFTGADRARRGLFAAADGGTIFLDEIGTAPLPVQVSLLRVLEERVVRPVGGERGLPVDVRVIAATNADLAREMEAGRFRNDLYWRLATVVVTLPPLRERKEDLPLLVETLLARLAARTGREVRPGPGVLERLAAWDWPGNVRELAHVLEQAVLLAPEPVLRPGDLPLPGDVEERVPTLEEVERDHVRRVLHLAGGNKLRAARLLGIPRGTLYRKIRRYGLEEGEPGTAGEGKPAPEAAREKRPPSPRSSPP